VSVPVTGHSGGAEPTTPAACRSGRVPACRRAAKPSPAGCEATVQSGYRSSGREDTQRRDAPRATSTTGQPPQGNKRFETGSTHRHDRRPPENLARQDSVLRIGANRVSGPDRTTVCRFRPRIVRSQSESISFDILIPYMIQR
jgi:hypothetical protein